VNQPDSDKKKTTLQEDIRVGRKALWAGLIMENPIFCQLLGVCSALAVTGKVINSIVMSIAVIFVTAMSNVLVSSLRRSIPRSVRMIAEVVVIAFFVIAFDQFLKAFWFDMSRELGPYVGLIITNCIVMGRAEAFALQNRPVPSFFDGIGNGLGYAGVLIAVAVIRELTGSATLLAGTPWAVVIKAGEISSETPYLLQIPIPFEPSQMMILAPGAFFTMGVLIFIFRAIRPEETN